MKRETDLPAGHTEGVSPRGIWDRVREGEILTDVLIIDAHAHFDCSSDEALRKDHERFGRYMDAEGVVAALVMGKSVDHIDFLPEHERLLELGQKDERIFPIINFDAPFASLTFFHYIEHMYRDRLPYSLYHPRAFEVPVIDRDGRRLTVFVYAFSPAIIKRRRPYEFEAEVRKQGLIRSAKIGNTQLEYIEVQPLLDFVSRMVSLGNYFFYDLS